MKRSHKVINIVYISFFLALIVIAGIMVADRNRAEWKSKEAAVLRCGNFAMDSFFSYTSLLTRPLSEDRLRELSDKILLTMDENIFRLTITDSVNEAVSPFLSEPFQMRAVFSKTRSDDLTMQLFCRADLMDTPCYITLYSDFTQLSGVILSRWHYYAGGVAAVMILGVSFFIILNLLWKESEKTKKFMENFTHELKTPITSLLGYTEMMSSFELNKEEQTQALNALSFEANRLNHLSAQMLNIFIAQNDKAELSPVSSGKIAAELSIPLKALSEKYTIPVFVRFDEDTLFCNKDLLLLLLSNLTDNAFKATVNAKRNKPVSITGACRGEEYLIAVKDHGIGIAKKHISRITEPFYREDKARSRAQGGAGLGLALCSEIAKMHGSELRFASRKGSGTRVSFRLRRTNV